jgi:eukaryotic-like serine/threonine-protein kinase
MTDQSRSNEIEVFQSCFELSPAAREEYLRTACADDGALRARVQRLLEAHDRAARDKFEPVMLPSESVPDVIGPYELVGILGEGGMGVVYEAEQRHPIQRRVALKIVKLGMDTRQVIARFMSERQALAAMDHPCVAKVFDAGQTVSGRPYFVMEIVRGEPLLDYCNRARLGLRERLSLFIRICQAVQHAHQKGVIHRDLKPSNLLVAAGDGQPVPKVIDFGISKAVDPAEDERRTRITRIGQPLGTPAYMSPEQAGFGGLQPSTDVDTRTDIYSLGVVLYQLLTGSLPVDPSTTGDALFLARLSDGDLVFPRPSVRVAPAIRIPPDLDWIVMKALEPDRNRRYDTALALADDVARYLRDEPVVAGPPVWSYRARKFVRRHRVHVVAATVAVVALIGGALTATVGFIRATGAEQQALGEAAKSREVADFLTGLFGASDPNLRASSTLRDVLDRGAATIDGRLERQPAVRASLFATMGHVYESLGMYKEAIGLAEKAVAAGGGADSLDVADAAMTLGRSRQNLGDFDGARQAFENALTIRTRLLGENHLDVAVALSGLGGLHSQLENFDASLDAHSRALAIQRALRGPDAIETTNSLRGMAIVYARRKEVERALELDRQVLAIYRKTYGDRHANVGSGLHAVSIDLLDLRRIEEARAAAEEGLLVRMDALGADHPQVAFSHHTLGDIHVASHRFRDALASYREALRIRETALGVDNPRTADVVRAIGRLRLREGDATGARPLFERSLRIYEKAYGPHHSKTMGARTDVETAAQQLASGSPVRAR